MSARDVARALAGGRIAIAIGLLVAPRLSLRIWIGRQAAARAVAPVGRALGIRELVLGGMLLHTIDRPQAGPRWLRAVAACDAVDLVATIAARRALPAHSRPLIVAMAGAATVGQLWAARELATGEAQEQPGAIG